MTYCVNQWISSFTYSAIRDRLNQENVLPAGMPAGGVRPRSAAKGGKDMSRGGMIHVVATVNLTAASGRFQHVTPQPVATSGGPATPVTAGSRSKKTGKPNLTVRAYTGAALVEYKVDFIQDACRDPGDEETGAVDAFIPQSAALTRLELLLNGSVIDTFSPAATAKPVRNIRSAARSASGRTTRRGGRGLADAAAGDPDFPTISWDAPGGTRGDTRGLADAPGTVYSVQISTDSGKTWQTVGFDLHEPKVDIDRGLIGDAKTVKVRITSTDGFRSVTTEKNLKASDLG
jgi:hypothetical protein